MANCKGLKGKALIACKEGKLTYKNFAMANQARNNSEGFDTKKPASRIDSNDYKRGFSMGLKKLKPSALKLRYQGENEFEKMGRWEGQNVYKN